MSCDREINLYLKDLPDLGIDFLSILREGALREPDGICEAFGLPVGNLTYVIGNLPKSKADMLASVGGLPYIQQLDPWIISTVDRADKRPDVASGLQKILEGNAAGYHTGWRVKALMLALRHWILAKEMSRSDKELSMCVFSLSNDQASWIEGLSLKQIEHIACLTWDKFCILQSVGQQVAYVLGEAESLDQVLQTFRFAGSATATHKLQQKN